MNQKKNTMRILHLINGADLGGISTFILNYYSLMNQMGFHFDFAMYDEQVGHNGKILQSMGCQFYNIPGKKHIIRYTRALKRIIIEGQYDGIHVHTNTSSYVPLLIAKRLGIMKRVAHAHSAVRNPSIIYRMKAAIGHKLIPITATDMCACSKIAGEVVFGKNTFKIVPNGIDIKKFAYDAQARARKRLELGITDDISVIGMIGRLSSEKNTAFALKVINHMPDNVRLIVAGDGPLRLELEKKASDHVIFLGQRFDANELYQAFDLFFLPSIFEGFPISALEAISAGLPVILSNSITDEVNFGERVSYLPIDEKSIDKWVSCANRYLSEKKRTDGHEVVENKYDIGHCVSILESVYKEGRG